MFSLTTLGAVRLRGPDGEVLKGRRKELALLAYLARGSGRAPRDELATLLWSERQQARARHSLRQVLLRLRRALGDVVRVEGDTVDFDGAEVEVDATDFEAHVAAGRPGEAEGLWKGEFLKGLDDAGGEPWQYWLHAQREALAAGLAGAMEQLVRDARADRDRERARSYASRWVELFPLAERPRTVLIGLLREEGRTAEAVAQHESYVARLAREVEAQPSTTFLALRTELEEDPVDPASTVLTPGSVALFTPAMVGRASALSALAEAWSSVCAGEAIVMVVEGESGIGKTRLCEEFLREASAGGEGVQLFRARSREEEPAPLSTLRELLAPLPAAPGLGGVSDAALAELARVVPGVRGRFSHLPEPTGDGAALGVALREALTVVAEEAPVILFLDDGAQMDVESGAVLAPLLTAPPPGLLVLLTTRTLGEAAVLRTVTRVGAGRRYLKLGPLGPDDMDALVGSMIELSADDRPALSARLHSECGGNPFYAFELVSGLVDEGLLAPDARGIWHVEGSDAAMLSLPHGLRDTVRRRLRGLPGSAAHVAAAAAGLPEPVDVSLLQAACGLPRRELEVSLGELLARRLLRELPGRAGVVEFIHPLVRRVAGELEHAVEVRDPPSPDGERSEARKVPIPRRGVFVAVTLVALALIVGTAVRWRSGQAPASTPLLAIGALADLSGDEEGGIAAALSDMLATNLARVPGLQVVSSARMYELLGQLGSAGDPRAALAEAARQAGADHLLEGSVLSGPAGLRLDLRSVDLRTGEVEHAARVDGADVFEVVDVATAAVASGMGLRAEALHLSEATTTSLVAYRFYEEGLRKFAGADYRGALQLMDASLSEDSTFALAAYYAWRSHAALDQEVPAEVEARMLRLADRAPDRDRLLIRGVWALRVNDAMLTAVADTLAIRYPADPEGRYLAGVSRFWGGAFADARAALEQVVTMDSLGLRGTHALCLACDALEQIVDIHIHADSLDAARRLAQEWVGVQPASARAWEALSAVLLYGGRLEEASAARVRATALSPSDAHGAVFPAVTHIYAGEFGAADALLREMIRSGTPAVRQEATWFLAISLRQQGRFREALELLRGSGEPLWSGSRRHEGQVLYEMGRYRDAAALFDSLAHPPEPRSIPGSEARQRVLNLTGLATALAAAGDTASLPALADSVEAWGMRSAFGRDRRLHHHVRGLLFAARGARELAVLEFREAMFSATLGYTRTNVELARALVATGRSREAAGLLRSALRGSLEASNLFVTRTELEASLGHALEAAGEADSAAVYYRRAMAAWSATDDPSVRATYDSIGADLSAIMAAATR